jgi:hypothetical protein
LKVDFALVETTGRYDLWWELMICFIFDWPFLPVYTFWLYDWEETAKIYQGIARDAKRMEISLYKHHQPIQLGLWHACK